MVTKETRNRKQRREKFLVRLAKILGTGVFICTILLLFPIALPRIMGYQTFNVISGSMTPEIPVGSLILVEDIECRDLKQGDIIAFYSDEIVVAHRVVENNSFEGKISTKGDANPTEDFKIVEYDDVIGIVSHHYPFVGTIGAYLSSVSGKLLIVELLVIAVLLHVVADKIKV